MKTLLLLSTVLFAGSSAAFWLAGVSPYRWTPTLEAQRARATREPPRILRVLGYVEPTSEIRKLTFKAEGVIESCFVDVGQRVSARDVLATLRSRDERAAVAVAEQELALAAAEQVKLLSGSHPQLIEAAKRRVAKNRERARYARLQLERQEKLFGRNVATQEDYDLARTNLIQSDEDLNESLAQLNELANHVRPEDKALAAAKVSLAAANLEAAKERLQNTFLRAPVAGTVLEILKREGDAVRAIDQRPTIVFADLSEVRVRAEVDERCVSLIRIGQTVDVYGRGLGDRRYSATLALIKPLMGNKTVFSRDAGERKDLDVLEVFVQPDAPISAPIGMQVEVDIHLAPQERTAADSDEEGHPDRPSDAAE
jgi:multidrug resistance efflux pump